MPTKRRAKSRENDVLTFIQNLPPDYLECRQYGHAWGPHEVHVDQGIYDVTIQCSRCFSSAREVISRRGERLRKRSVRYSEGYLTKGLGRLDGDTRSMLRLEGVLRMVDPNYHKAVT